METTALPVAPLAEQITRLYGPLSRTTSPSWSTAQFKLAAEERAHVTVQRATELRQRLERHVLVGVFEACVGRMAHAEPSGHLAMGEARLRADST